MQKSLQIDYSWAENRTKNEWDIAKSIRKWSKRIKKILGYKLDHGQPGSNDIESTQTWHQ